jgi:hypothetical protein
VEEDTAGAQPTAPGVGGLGAAIFLWNLLRYDANVTAMLSFYRDRLSAAYIRTWTPQETATADNNEQRLSELQSRGPYHIINTTMNLQGADDLTLHGRDAKVFVLTKRFCGYTDSGGSHYAETENLEKSIRI